MLTFMRVSMCKHVQDILLAEVVWYLMPSSQSSPLWSARMVLWVLVNMIFKLKHFFFTAFQMHISWRGKYSLVYDHHLVGLYDLTKDVFFMNITGPEHFSVTSPFMARRHYTKILLEVKGRIFLCRERWTGGLPPARWPKNKFWPFIHSEKNVLLWLDLFP